MADEIIIDDSWIARLKVGAVLTKAGHTVNALESGIEIGKTLSHTLPDPIILGLDKDANALNSILGDDGIGKPESLNFNKSDSLGLLIVKTLTEQLKGKLTVTGKDHVEITIDFPA